MIIKNNKLESLKLSLEFTPIHLLQKDLSNRLANRAETLRHRTLSKSPSRSPGRAPRGLRSPPMESRLPPSAVDVKLERREDNAHSVNGTAQPVIKKERRSGDATSLQNDQNGQVRG